MSGWFVVVRYLGVKYRILTQAVHPGPYTIMTPIIQSVGIHAIVATFRPLTVPALEQTPIILALAAIIMISYILHHFPQ